MDEVFRDVEMPVLGMSCAGCVVRIREALSQMKGVEGFDGEIGKVRFRYNPYQVSIERIRSAITALGYRLSPEWIRNPFKRFLARMAENNEKQFGNERLDCCTMKKK